MMIPSLLKEFDGLHNSALIAHPISYIAFCLFLLLPAHFVCSSRFVRGSFQYSPFPSPACRGCLYEYHFYKIQKKNSSKLDNALCAVRKVYFSAQPNKLRHILNFDKYYPIEHIFVPACSSARKEHFFKF